jgi:hypothetical protein
MSHAVISSACVLGLFFSSAAQPGTAAVAGARAPVAIDACALLQGAEISQAIGAPVGEPARQDAGLEPDGSYSSSCVWEIHAANPTAANAAAPLGGKSFVILHAMQWPRGSGLAHTFLDSFRDAAENGDLPGKIVPREFGDDALWWGDGLAVRKYDVSFGISVFFPGSKANRTGAFEEQLAPHILRRLEKRASELQQRRPGH